MSLQYLGESVRSSVAETLERLADAIRDAMLDSSWAEGPEADGPGPPLPSMDVNHFVELMRGKVEETLRKAGQIINDAPTGEVAAASAGQLDDLFGELSHLAVMLGLQLRLEAAEVEAAPGQRPQGDWAKRWRRMKAGG